jgi:N-acetylglucosaminyldiphosphoundecaprenol N-acetyl-beta-D-mannosaminyltransferase
VKRISLLKVPLDIVPPEDLVDLVCGLLSGPNRGTGQNIVLLSLWDLLRARRNKEYRALVRNAAAVIPISKSLVSGAKFLTGKTPVRYMPFNFVVSLLNILDARELTVYLLGGRTKTLRKAERNIRQTFPKLRVVGRFVGNFRKQDEDDILEAIHKAAPHLLLVGRGVKGGELWISRHSVQLGGGIRLWCSDLMDILAGHRQRPSEGSFNRGLEWVGYCVRSPLKCFRLFSYLRYKVLLLVYKILKKT